MTETADEERRKVQRKVAREYRRLGFKVLETPTDADLPAFLSGFAPDLIATNDDEQVVVEIKRADKLKGSNDLTELAARVAEHPTWRFELIALEAPGASETRTVSVGELGLLFKAAMREFEAGNDTLRRTLLIGLTSILEALLHQVALERGVEIAGRSMGALIRELSFQGIVDDALMTGLERARTWREAVLHGGTVEPATGREQIALLTKNFSDLQDALIEFWDAGATDRMEIDCSTAAISELPEARPAVYAVQAAGGRVNYVGFAAAGQVREGIRQHIGTRSPRVPSKKLIVLLFDTEEKARRAETIASQEFLPRYNRTSRDSERASRRA